MAQRAARPKLRLEGEGLNPPAVQQSESQPLMADLFAGPNVPLTKAFILCGWRTLSVDWLLDPTHDLSNPDRQSSLAAQLKEASFIAAALDCSTKSGAREIPRDFADGRPAPKPLRSPRFPEGLPELTGRDKERVERDNMACSFVLEQIQLHTDRR